MSGRAVETPISAYHRAAWERRAITIESKAKALLDDMLAVVEQEHILTDFADSLVHQAETLSEALARHKGSRP